MKVWKGCAVCRGGRREGRGGGGIGSTRQRDANGKFSQVLATAENTKIRPAKGSFLMEQIERFSTGIDGYILCRCRYVFLDEIYFECLF